MRISDWSSDVCSSDLRVERVGGACAPLDQGSLQNGAELEALAGVEQRVGRVVRYLEFLSVQCDPSLLHEAEAQRHHLLRRALAVQCLCPARSEEHTSELQSLMRISYAVFCLKKKNKHISNTPKQSDIYHQI